MRRYLLLELSELYTKVAVISPQRDKISIENADYLLSSSKYYISDAVESIQEEAKIIEKLYEKVKFNKKNVNIILPSSQSYFQILEMPMLKEKELISAVRYQADQIIPVPINEVSFDVKVISENKKEKKLLILVVAAKQKLINKIVLTSEESGLAADSLENEFSSVFSLIEWLKEKKAFEENILFLNFGYASSSLFIFDRKEERTKYLDQFNIGAEVFIKELGLNLQLQREKVIELMKKGSLFSDKKFFNILLPSLREFLQRLESYLNMLKVSKNIKISKMVLFGDGAYFPEIATLIQKYTGLSFYPFSGLSPYLESKKDNFSEKDYLFYLPLLGGVLRNI